MAPHASEQLPRKRLNWKPEIFSPGRLHQPIMFLAKLPPFGGPLGQSQILIPERCVLFEQFDYH